MNCLIIIYDYINKRGEHDEKNERFEYDCNGLANSPFLCGHCYNVLEEFEID